MVSGQTLQILPRRRSPPHTHLLGSLPRVPVAPARAHGRGSCDSVSLPWRGAGVGGEGTLPTSLKSIHSARGFPACEHKLAPARPHERTEVDRAKWLEARGGRGDPFCSNRHWIERFYEVQEQGWGCSMVTSVLVSKARPCRSEQIPDLDTKDGDLSP